ncbi:MAG: SAM-dependent methyltransferase, partial [Myxococcales bacterium]|nr:SAM-dependent methyltransferase [Myxococcales bacterium]
VNRLPILHIDGAEKIYVHVDKCFSIHESHREPSVEFFHPGPSPWRHAQEWAQIAVDRPENTPLPVYTPEHDREPATDHLSYALGVALGRFGPSGEGILDPRAAPGSRDHALLASALPAGILFLDTTLDAQDYRDSLGHPAAAPLLAAWERHGHAIAPGSDLRAFLTASGAKGFFELHRKMYESRPIHWPLASEGRTFVAWVTIHRWDAQTLRVLLADHLQPTLTRLDGELADLRAARDGDDKKASRAAEKRLANVLKARDELAGLIATVEQCAEKGPPGAAAKATAKAKGKGRGKAAAKGEEAGAGQEREVDARYDPDLDDGVMVNSAALWPLLLPFWKEPQKWWRELAAGAGKKDYDWAHLAMRYWPKRVDAKCQQDPSLAVAHGCFWRYHPKRAWAWELRLQDEIAQDFRIDEEPYRGDGGSDAHRTVFIADHVADGLDVIKAEALRRIRKRKRPIPELRILEPGFWSVVPDECWALEEAIIEKQESDFRLRAPDEPARAALLAANPALEAKRRELLESLNPTDLLLGGDDDEDEDDAGDEDDDDTDADDADGEEDDA